MRFENGVIAVLLINFNHPEGADAVLRKAFDLAAE
jgi:hypothetical protein